MALAGFGAPNRRKRVFVVASLHGDARDVLLSQVRWIPRTDFCCLLCFRHMWARLQVLGREPHYGPGQIIKALVVAQGVLCKGACYQLFNGKPCYSCHQAHGPDGTGLSPDCTYALDLSNAQCALTPTDLPYCCVCRSC